MRGDPAGDSIANRARDVGREAGRIREACALATTLTAPPPLPARYVDVDHPSGGSRRFVRRNSCCLIYVATDGDKCVSCPRQRPDERHARLVRHVP